MRLAVVKFLSVVLITTLITACGYRPSAKFSRDLIGSKISTDVHISSEDPENTVLIKDALDIAIAQTLQSSLTNRSESDTHLSISMKAPNYTPIQYDSNGYIIGYRMLITINIKKYQNGQSKNYTTQGSYDFSVTPNAIVTDQQRFDAIKLSASKAIDAFIAMISAEGARVKKE